MENAAIAMRELEVSEFAAGCGDRLRSFMARSFADGIVTAREQRGMFQGLGMLLGAVARGAELDRRDYDLSRALNKRIADVRG